MTDVSGKLAALLRQMADAWLNELQFGNVVAIQDQRVVYVWEADWLLAHGLAQLFQSPEWPEPIVSDEKRRELLVRADEKIEALEAQVGVPRSPSPAAIRAAFVTFFRREYHAEDGDDLTFIENALRAAYAMDAVERSAPPPGPWVQEYDGDSWYVVNDVESRSVGPLQSAGEALEVRDALNRVSERAGEAG